MRVCTFAAVDASLFPHVCRGAGQFALLSFLSRGVAAYVYTLTFAVVVAVHVCHCATFCRHSRLLQDNRLGL